MIFFPLLQYLSMVHLFPEYMQLKSWFGVDHSSYPCQWPILPWSSRLSCPFWQCPYVSTLFFIYGASIHLNLSLSLSLPLFPFVVYIITNIRTLIIVQQLVRMDTGVTAAVASASVCPYQRRVARRRDARPVRLAGPAGTAPSTSTNVPATTRAEVMRTAPTNRGRIRVSAMRDTTGWMTSAKVHFTFQRVDHVVWRFTKSMTLRDQC